MPTEVGPVTRAMNAEAEVRRLRGLMRMSAIVLDASIDVNSERPAAEAVARKLRIESGG